MRSSALYILYIPTSPIAHTPMHVRIALLLSWEASLTVTDKWGRGPMDVSRDNGENCMYSVFQEYLSKLPDGDMRAQQVADISEGVALLYMHICVCLRALCTITYTTSSPPSLALFCLQPTNEALLPRLLRLLRVLQQVWSTWCVFFFFSLIACVRVLRW